jgi:hypothetical protein
VAGTLFFWLNSDQIPGVLKPLAQLTFLLLFVCLSSQAWPQDLVYKHYDLQDGLPNPTIHSIFQDQYDDQVEAAGTKVTIVFHKITVQVDKDSYN